MDTGRRRSRRERREGTREMVPHVTFVAPVETEVTWDGTSPCALLKEFGDAMTSDSGTTITNTILPRTSPTTISVIDNNTPKTWDDRRKERRTGGKYGLPLW
jgi:hypothetical protein